LGWKPEAEFKDSLVEIVEYYKENFIWWKLYH
jgi:dTDP-D-glucose 4,6-dehydratase